MSEKRYTVNGSVAAPDTSAPNSATAGASRVDDSQTRRENCSGGGPWVSPVRSLEPVSNWNRKSCSMVSSDPSRPAPAFNVTV